MSGLAAPTSDGDLPPQARGVEHVGLVHRGDLAAPAAGEAERQLQDAADLVVVILERVGDLDVAAGQLLARLPAEVQAAGQLAEDQHVHALELLGLERRRVDQRWMDLDRAQVGEDAEPLAQRQEALLRPDLAVGIVPLRPAHGAQQHGVARLARGQRLVGQRRAMPIDRAAADRLLVELEGVAVRRRDGLEHPPALRDHLRADAVARQQHDLCSHVCLR